MATKKRSHENWGGGVQVNQVRLASLAFDAGPDAEVPDDDRVTGNFILNVARASLTEIAVEFGAEVEGIPHVTARCTYRAFYRLRPGSPEEQQPDAALLGVATRVAPVMLYPFVREALQNAASRAGLPDFLLQIVSFSSLFSDFELPAVEEEVEET